MPSMTQKCRSIATTHVEGLVRRLGLLCVSGHDCGGLRVAAIVSDGCYDARGEPVTELLVKGRVLQQKNGKLLSGSVVCESNYKFFSIFADFDNPTYPSPHLGFWASYR